MKMTKKMTMKQAKHEMDMGKNGMDMGKKGKNFKKIVKKATKKYGSKAIGKKVAGAILKKKHRKGTL